MPVFLRTPYNYDMREASKEAAIVTVGPSMAVQSPKEEVDINTIVKRFGLTGELPVNQRVPLLVDFDEILDYRTCLDAVMKAKASFDAQPAAVRARFENDPARLVDFVMDDGNREEAVRLGLVPAPAPAPVPAPEPAPAS